MLYMIIDAIESYIEHYNQSINQKNKQTYGEVFTPFTLVRTMVDTIPIHIWRNPRLQWLDPANGTGHFMMIVFSRLWRELREWEPDDLKRENHILTKKSKKRKLKLTHSTLVNDSDLGSIKKQLRLK